MNTPLAPIYDLKPKDFETDQDVRWCPGCGDYSILKQVQIVMPQLALRREEVAIISGIGCSSRFPYYMETYGLHSIHGRAAAVATGLRIANPQLHVWMVTGDGDCLSIGGNHFIHLLRRNVDINILLFNNQIYGLTKGQYSPTSEAHKITKSTPIGSIDHPLNPLALALGADASFVARSLDRDPKHLQAMLHRCHTHKGSALLEIYQNCNIFNDAAFEIYTDKSTKANHAIFVENKQPLIYGNQNQYGIRLDGSTPQRVLLDEGNFSTDDLWLHDESDLFKAQILARFFDDHTQEPNALPRVFGVLYAQQRPCYEHQLHEQIDNYSTQKGQGNLDQLLAGNETWTIA